MHIPVKTIYSVVAAGLLVMSQYAGAAQGTGKKPANPGKEAASRCQAECKSHKQEDGAFERCIVKCMNEKKSTGPALPKR